MLAFGLLFAKVAFATTGAARVVLVSFGNVELARRVRAEAEHSGILVASEPGSARQSDAELLQRHDAVGVVELTASDRVRIYVAPSGEHAAYETVIERAPADGDGFALRVVEQVRGRLVELKLLLPESAGVAPEPAPASPNPPPAPIPSGSTTSDSPSSERGRPGLHSPTLGLTVGGAGTIAAGGLGVTPAAALGLRLEPAPRWAAALHVLLPIAENDFFAPEGQASVRVNLLFAELGYELAPASASIRPELGAGAGLVILPMEGETVAPLEAHADRLVAGIYFLHAGAGFALEPWLRLRGSVRAGLSAPRPVIEFSDHEVAAWGRGFFVATLEAEFRLPLSSSEGAP